MSGHPFDEALRLDGSAAEEGACAGRTSDDYWNMVGPFGGTTAAVMLQAVLRHPRLLGAPVSLTVNYAGPVAAGPFAVRADPVRTNRTTQHWTVVQSQPGPGGIDMVATTATVVTATRRATWGADDQPPPTVPAPQQLARAVVPALDGMQWLGHYDLRPILGHVPERWDGQGDSSLSQLWVRDEPPRPLDFCSLAAMADIFFPRVWLRRATMVPAGTVSITVYFHADAAVLAEAGTGYLLGQARAQAFRDGFFDHAGQLWSEAGRLLATTHQIVYFKA